VDESSTLIPSRLTIKRGATVMLLVNLTPILYNGSVGEVIDFNDDEIIVKFDGLQEAEVIERKKVEFNNGKQSRSQFPLVLSFGRTIHKAQGQTLDCVEIDLEGAFTYGQVYVALSRAKSEQKLIVRNYHPNLVKVNARVVEFYNRI
jgi:ATP-dependent DNA helicase PIF1